MIVETQTADAKDEKSLMLAIGRTKKEMSYLNKSYSVNELFDLLIDESKRKHIKNGCNFAQGNVTYDRTSKNENAGRILHRNIDKLSIIAFDVDDGTPLKDAITKVEQLGYLAVYYTSFDHPKNGYDRYRIVLILKEPFVISTLKSDSKIWVKLYTAVGESLGIKFDPSCTNIGRKLYFPATRKEKEKYAASGIINPDGKFVDLNDFTLPDMSEYYPSESTDVFTNSEYNLSDSDKSYAKNFKMAKLFKSNGLDLKDRPDGGYEIICPHGDDHASNDPYGAFVTDADGENGYNISCSHATCIKKFGDRHQRLHHLKRLIDDGIFSVSDLENPEYGGGKPRTELPSGYIYSGTAILKFRGEEKPVLVCDGVEFVSNSRDYDSNWTLACAVTAPDGVRKNVYLPKRIIGKDAAIEELRGAGAMIPAHGKTNMTNLLTLVKPEKQQRNVTKGGWYDDKFVLTGDDVQVFGSDEEVIYTPAGGLKPAFNISGDLSDWQREIASKAVGNSRLEFVLCAAFAAPLLAPLNISGGGFHLHGGSSIGKTIATKVFGSVFGGPDYIHTHRGTDNALESVAEMHNDTGLVLDEISQADAKTIGATIYMLANGEGKSRANPYADAKPVKTWRVLVLSTGELTIGDKIKEDNFGPTVKAGQSVRMVDLVADAGAGMGIVENPHGLTSGAFVDGLSDAATTYYGAAIRAFLSYLVEHKSETIQEAAETMKAFSDAVVPTDADGQVGRVADRFGVCAAAGELAIKAGVLPWKQGDAVKACERMFNEWVAVHGYGSIEVAKGVASVEIFLVNHGATRFQNHDAPDQPVYNRVGWYKDGTENDGIRILYIPVAMWPEVCGGYNPEGTAKALADNGILQPNKDGKLTQKFRPRGLKPIWCRVLRFEGEMDYPALDASVSPKVNLQGNLKLRKPIVYLALGANTKSPEVLVH